MARYDAQRDGKLKLMLKSGILKKPEFDKAIYAPLFLYERTESLNETEGQWIVENICAQPSSTPSSRRCPRSIARSRLPLAFGPRLIEQHRARPGFGVVEWNRSAPQKPAPHVSNQFPGRNQDLFDGRRDVHIRGGFFRDSATGHV